MPLTITLTPKPLNRTTLVFLLLLILIGLKGYGQSFVINFPTSPEDATACNDPSLLTVRMNVLVNSSSGADVTIDLADGMEYEAGSVTKIGGTAALTISENGGTPNQPTFTLGPSNLNVSDFIIFTIQRKAICEAYTNVLSGEVFQDEIFGTINGSTSNEISAPYTINFPSLTLVQPSTINNAEIGNSYSRNFSIVNGADGCANAVHFTIEYEASGISFESLTLDGNNIVPTSVVGNTYSFTVSGGLLTGDGQLCNGEALTFIETVAVTGCSPSTDYTLGWGCGADPLDWCTQTTGIGSVNMASGAPNLQSTTNTMIGYVDMCTPFQVEVDFTNTGTGPTNAATMYNVKLQKGRGGGGTSLYAIPTQWNFTNPQINGQNVPFAMPGRVINIALEDHFTVDPDGAGVGLDDIDGDGFYDDLPKNSTVTFVIDLAINCTLSCGSSVWMRNLSGKTEYNTMCSNDIVQTPRVWASGTGLEYTISQYVTTGYMPANISNNTAFRTRLSASGYYHRDDYDTADTRYVYELTLPPGVSVSGTGNVEWFYGEYPANGGSIASTYTQVGNLVSITSPNNGMGYAFIDLVYDCSGSSAVDLDYKLRKINNPATGCACMDEFACGTISAQASCPGGCAAGPSSEIPIVRRADNSLGWTDATMNTKQIAANISTYDLSKALYLDEIEIHGNATQNGPSSSLGARLSLPKVNATTNKLEPLNVDVTIRRGGAVVGNGTLTSFSMTASTASDQHIDWDLSTVIPAGGMLDGDEIETISRYQVATNSLTQHDTQSGGSWYFYNIDPVGGGQVFCNFFVPEMYLVGTRSLIGTNSYSTNGCTETALGGGTNYLARRFNSAGVLFANEYRPVMYVESIEAIIPDGYDFISARELYGANNLLPDAISGNTYTFNNPGDWRILGLTVTNTYGQIYPFTVQANCNTEASEPILFNFKIKDYYYHYAENDPSSTAYEITMTNSRNIAHINSPDIALSNQSGAIQASKPLESWVVRLSNPSQSTAPYNWISIDDVPGVTITKVSDVATGTTIPPTAYAGGDIYHLDTAGVAPGTFKDYEIEFSYTVCEPTDVKIYGGWNCNEYPTDPNLETCDKEELDFSFTPANGEVEIISVTEPASSIDLCSPVDYEFHLNSAQAGNIIDNEFTIIAPTGMTPVTGNLEAEYPAGSGNWTAIALTSNIGSNFTYDLTTHPNYPALGLPGTLNDGGDANIRLFPVRFQMITDCSFVAGSNFQVSASANNICGSAAVGNSLESQTVSTPVTGAETDYAVVSTLNFASGSTPICGGAIVLDATETIISTSPIGSNGVIEIELPQGYVYDLGSFICTTTLCSTFDSVFTNVNGREVIKLLLPAGLDNTDLIGYSYGIAKDPSAYAPCGDLSINVLAKDETSNVACATEGSGFCPTVSIQTGFYTFNYTTIVKTVITNRRITKRVNKN